MPHAILLNKPGGPEQLSWQEIAAPKAGPGEAVVRQNAVGVNFIDIYHRTGLYPLPYPAVLGMEAAGVVESVGQGVDDFKPGDRVAYTGHGPGSYATHRAIEARHLVKLPEGVSDDVAASLMVKGITAHYLLARTYPVKKGDTILVHAAAGGVGLIMCQWAHRAGATVIGTVGTEEKALLARAHGADHTIIYTREKVSARVLEITKGHGVNVVYDSVGQATFMDSLDCLEPLGMMVSFGQSSGKIPPFDTNILASKGSLYLTRPSLMHYIANVMQYRKAAAELFALVASGELKVHIDRTLPLEQAAEAHRLLESRSTSGAVVLKCGGIGNG